MADLDAISAALELVRKPVLVHAARGAPLPDGIATMLHIAVGHPEITAMASRSSGRSEDSLRQAAAFFIEQILLDPAADSYRRLGLDNKASPRELRLHMALLTRWLHPDAAATSDRALYATRLTSAWEDVKSGPRRDRYDQARLVEAAKTSTSMPARGSRGVKVKPAANGSGKKPSPHVPTELSAVTKQPKRRRFRRLSLFRQEGDGLLTRLLASLRRTDR
ncbi:MAG: hypothetical protein JNM89_11035 [Hyphomicrobiaceae bacterium]|nr:hypothetical protein [Hyphomicrobiaceae bacterium]